MNNLRKQLGLDRTRQQPKTTTAPPPAAKKAKKPARVEADPDSIITHSCGHKTGARFLQGSPCPGCVRQARQKRREGQQQRQTVPRLPDGATFSATYDAAAERWAGSLVIGGRVFEAEAGAVFCLLKVLDGMYRATLNHSLGG